MSRVDFDADATTCDSVPSRAHAHDAEDCQGGGRCHVRLGATLNAQRWDTDGGSASTPFLPCYSTVMLHAARTLARRSRPSTN